MITYLMIGKGTDMTTYCEAAEEGRMTLDTPSGVGCDIWMSIKDSDSELFEFYTKCGIKSNIAERGTVEAFFGDKNEMVFKYFGETGL